MKSSDPNSEPVIIISRTDGIGDVVLSLPLAGIIKKNIPKSKIIFLGRNYTKDVIALSEHVDEFVSYDDILKLSADEQVHFFRKLNADWILHVFPVKEIAWLAKKAKIKYRVGTRSRLWHWFTCNVRMNLSRKNSDLHEAQLNAYLLQPLKIKYQYTTKEISEYYGFTHVPVLENQYRELLSKEKKNIILHPKSKGSAREWGLDNFSNLIDKLDKDKFKIFISGAAAESEALKQLAANHNEVVDLSGKLSLNQFIAFIAASDGLVGASTGPLHIAAALGVKAIGLYPPIRPMHPGRWKPLGSHVGVLVINKKCSDCRNIKNCECLMDIQPRQVIEQLLK